MVEYEMREMKSWYCGIRFLFIILITRDSYTYTDIYVKRVTSE